MNSEKSIDFDSLSDVFVSLSRGMWTRSVRPASTSRSSTETRSLTGRTWQMRRRKSAWELSLKQMKNSLSNMECIKYTTIARNLWWWVLLNFICLKNNDNFSSISEENSPKMVQFSFSYSIIIYFRLSRKFSEGRVLTSHDLFNIVWTFSSNDIYFCTYKNWQTIIWREFITF